MNKHDYQEVKLAKGNVRVYDCDGVKLHAYQTNDLIDDEVFIVEKDGRGFVLELPCFFDNIQELEEYLANAGITIEGILAAYHMAGGAFLKGTPVYATESADKYGHEGGGKGLIDNFTAAFGEAFDGSICAVTNIIGEGPLTLGGIEVNILPNDEACDVEIPALNAVYTHMLGHDCHSIVAGAGHADAIIAQLQGFENDGFDLVLTSHYTPEDLKDVQTKIDYLEELKKIAAQCESKQEFEAAVEQQYPTYSGQNYLDMTAGFFFAE